jgi:hypothetical protein
MKTRFRVQSAEPIRHKQRFILLGEVLEGDIKVGMLVSVPLNRGVSIQAEVAGIETACREAGCDSGFSIQCDSDEEVSLWVALNIGDGEELLLTDESPNA